MRDRKRIKEFCNQLANIWESQCPDWRFGQLISNVFTTMQRDPFFYEEPEMIEIFKKYFGLEDT